MSSEPLIPQIDDSVIRAFQESQNKSEVVDVLKELFDQQKINMIGDLKKDEIRLITRMHMIAQLKNLEIWDGVLDYYMTLLISRDRKGRTEIIKAVQGFLSRGSMMQRLDPRNWGGRGRI